MSDGSSKFAAERRSRGQVKRAEFFGESKNGNPALGPSPPYNTWLGSSRRRGRMGQERAAIRGFTQLLIPKHQSVVCSQPGSQSSEVKICSPNTWSRTPGRGYQASSQSELGVSCKLCPSSEEQTFVALNVRKGRSSLRPQSEYARSIREGDLFLVADAPHGGRKRPRCCSQRSFKASAKAFFRPSSRYYCPIKSRI